MHGFPILVSAAAWVLMFMFGGRKAPDTAAHVEPPAAVKEILCVADEDISTAPMMVINGHLYYDTFQIRGDTNFAELDGRVRNSVSEGQVPGTEGESNFGTGYGYRYGINDTVEVEIDGVCHIFKPD